ncbi:MAG: hypothetical protein E7277_08085 [Lachnospiraceae bacterium]|nr:hypothetical protein [Lachnospiraceae bacterium]
MNRDEIVLKQRLEELEHLEVRIRKARRQSKVLPKGELRVTKNRGRSQYYFRKEGEAKSRYISKKEEAFVRGIAQREYDEKLLKQIEKQKKIIRYILKNYRKDNVEAVYETLCQGRKDIILPRIVTEKESIEEWLAEHPGDQNAYDKTRSFETIRGEMVRSKSEKILADLFYSKGIPYQYEPRLELGYDTIYPDFILFHVRRRESTYWEHFGLSDNPEYAVKNFKRLDDYERHGYYVGKDVLFSIESAKNPLDVKLVEEKLQDWLDK